LLALPEGNLREDLAEPAAVATSSPSLPVAPATTIATTTTTSTSIPTVEAFVPLTVDTVAQRIGPSVAFVLTQQGAGSGVVISDEHLVTNAHVVWPDRTVTLVFLNGATFQARVLAMDPFVDLAVVDISRLSRKPLPVVAGSTADVSVGEELWIVGYPLPSEFTPEPSVDIGELIGFSDWEFSGVQWFSVAAPALGGQSGGAVIDPQGRLVGISTFGSTTSLTSIGIDDVLTRVEEMLEATTVRGLEPRQVPHAGARRTLDVSLDGVWDQQLFVGWLPGATEVVVSAPGSGIELSARTIDGTEIAQGSEELMFRPGFVLPVVLAAQAAVETTAEMDGSLPFIAWVDPDHGRTLSRVGAIAGVYDVGRDRDFYYLELPEGDTASITIESAARTHLWVYGPDGGLVAEDIDESGFIGGNASVDVTAHVAGRYVVALESRFASISGYSVVTR
jgi:S1-C subfamily serine protease